MMVRGDVLRQIDGFDEQFFFHYEEVDLCFRVWESGHPIRFTPKVTITHLGRTVCGPFPVRFAIETTRNCYRYFYKHFGAKGAQRCRKVMLAASAHPAGGLWLAVLAQANRNVTTQDGYVPARNQLEFTAGPDRIPGTRNRTSGPAWRLCSGIFRTVEYEIIRIP